MLISGYGSIYFSYYIGWQNVYKLLALSVILLLIILTYCLKKLRDELDLNNPIKFPISCHVSTKNGFFQNIISPIGSVYLFILITSFLLLYRLPDDCISIMINPFLLHLGYHELEIANLGKLLGIISAVIGGFAASFVMRKKSIIDSLLIFGILHAMSHLLFIILGFYGKNQFVLFITIGVEGVTSGMNMAAYIAFISSICSGRFKATQYSFFSSMMGLSRSIFPAFFGYMLINQGFNFFFSFVIFATIPALLILLKIRRKFAMLHNL
jgi:PAT family beta-lactamase induction signal transducer AmpG